jgi:hypothetical protein
MGRGGRRPGAGRKPTHLKPLVIRNTDLIRLSPEELQALDAIARKLALPAPDGPQNQIESKPATRKGRDCVAGPKGPRKPKMLQAEQGPLFVAGR